MKIGIPQNLRTEIYPYRQISVTSFVVGGLSIILGIILLLSVKSDFKSGYSILAIEKIITGISFLSVGSISVWRGYQNEYLFSLEDIFDPAHGENVNALLVQRTNNPEQIASEYAKIMHSKTYNLFEVEKGKIKDWQFLFYKLFSKGNISKIFDHVPYPITRFIANQSNPISVLLFFVILISISLFALYLDIIPMRLTWINLFNLTILVGILSIWRPSKIDSVIDKNKKRDLHNRIYFFVIFFIVTIFLYSPYAAEISVGLLISILLVAGIMVFTAILAFKLIEQIFSNREIVNVSTSAVDLSTYRASTQPNNILQQFDNTIKSTSGWYFRNPTKDIRGFLAGDQSRKGDFKYEYIYETQPQIFSTKYDEKSEKLLNLTWQIGTVLLCIGLILIFSGIFITPSIDFDSIRSNQNSALETYSTKILLSLYLGLIGIAIYFFGKKLIYEIYIFFNTEIFFESNLILFGAYGNYDELKQTTGGIERRDTSTDFTPEVKVSKVISSVFVHPYLAKGSLAKRERFITKITTDDNFLNKILKGFGENMGAYMCSFSANNMTSRITESEMRKNLNGNSVQ